LKEIELSGYPEEGSQKAAIQRKEAKRRKLEKYRKAFSLANYQQGVIQAPYRHLFHLVMIKR
jgi:hypothetical protein